MLKTSLRITILFIVAIATLFLSWTFYKNSHSEPQVTKSTELKIGEHVWVVEIASTDTEKQNGLSNRSSLPAKTGMLFLFEKEDYQFFWMKDMLIPLDIIFIDENWRIVLIEKDLSVKSFPKIFGNSVKSKYVFEINSGEADYFNLKVGDEVLFIDK